MRRSVIISLTFVLLAVTGWWVLGKPADDASSGPAPQVAEADRPATTLRVRPARPGEHPLAPSVEWAQAALPVIQQIADYTCTFVKTERVGKSIVGPQTMRLKVRHRPFSVYMRFLEPAAVRDREAIYVAGRNDGNLIAHPTGLQHNLIASVALDPRGTIAMMDNRHPITEAGVLDMIRQLIEIGQREMQLPADESLVRIDAATLDERPVTRFEIEHPRPDKKILFHLARVYIDDALNLPVRFEAYDFPDAQGKLPLLEQYTYLGIRENVGLTDRDFDPENPDYGFARGTKPKN
jgi:hypothetical protein